MFDRPDVIEYLTHTRTPGIERTDSAMGFVFNVATESFAELQIVVQGFDLPLRENRRGAEDDLTFLKRYRAALQPLPASPALLGARKYFQQRLVASGLIDEASTALPTTGDGARASAQDLLPGCRTHGPAFAAKAALGPRVALLAIHQAGRHLSHSHQAMLRALVARGYRTVLINSNSELTAGLAELDQGVCAGVVTRQDHGRDFASWLLGRLLLGKRLDRAEQVLFCNDSFLGPFDDLAGVLDHQARSKADVWAFTDSWERGWHLQSSFFTVSARCLRSEAFRRFADNYGYPNERDAVVREGEIRFSRVLLADGGFTLSALAPYAQLARAALMQAPATMAALRDLPECRDLPPPQTEDADPEPAGQDYAETALAWMRKLLGDLRQGLPRNPQHVFWEALLTDFRVPFVKKELLLANPAGVPDFSRILSVVAEIFGREHATGVELDMRAGAKRAPVA